MAYSEIYFVKKLWPDFNEKDFENIILDLKKSKETLEQYDIQKFY
jgi:undecaprenyl diphosphate synthase